MSTIKPPEQPSLITKLLISVLAILLVLLALQMAMVISGSNRVHASELNVEQQVLPQPSVEQSDTTQLPSGNFLSVSLGKTKSNLTIEQRNEFIKTSDLAPLKDQIIGKATTQTRQQMHQQKQQNINGQQVNQTVMSYHQFSIYSASTQLFDDFDYDGYYQSFSVVFDADFHSNYLLEPAYVYAELYLRRDGGPWIHYFSTDDFIIYGESSDDEYEVVTSLYQDYTSGEYDILIDLYEVGYSDVVATYSSDDDYALYALPLESDEYDQIYDDYDEHSYGHGHGAIHWNLLLLIWVVIFPRLSQRL